VGQAIATAKTQAEAEAAQKERVKQVRNFSV
jgi:hypothetical protein